MNNSELREHLEDRYREWRSILEDLPSDRLEEPDVAGKWSMKDLLAHLTGWNHHLVQRLRAAVGGEPQPSPPWPTHLLEEDDINAWIHEANKDRPLMEVLEETDRSLREVISLMDALPQDAKIEVLHRRGLDFHLIQIGEEKYLPGEFFDHFRDDHRLDVEKWLEVQRGSKKSAG